MEEQIVVDSVDYTMQIESILANQITTNEILMSLFALVLAFTVAFSIFYFFKSR